MLEIVNQHKNKAINGIVTITERFGSNYRTEKYELNSARRTLKFKII